MSFLSILKKFNAKLLKENAELEEQWKNIMLESEEDVQDGSSSDNIFR